MDDLKEYGPSVIRLMIGLLMLIPGISKIMNPDMIIGMLDGLGFPAAAAFGWILILSEILFGAAILAGWQLKYTVWPPVIILVVAIFTVHIPGMAENPMGVINLLWHISGIAMLVSLFLTGPGALALGQKSL